MLDQRELLAEFRPEDISLVVEREVSRSIAHFKSQESACAVLLAGQPGAGKTVLSSMLAKQFGGNAVLINGDEYRRYHPNYHKLYDAYGSDCVALTSKFSSIVTETLIDRLSSAHLNLIIEGTGRTVEVPLRTAEQLTAKGYSVDMAVIAARPLTSLISTILRFYEMNAHGTVPRATAMEAHDHIVEVLPGNLDVLWKCSPISQISIWDRELRQLYCSSSQKEAPSQTLTTYWNAPWEQNEIQKAYSHITALQKREDELSLGQGAAIQELRSRLMKAQMTETSMM